MWWVHNERIPGERTCALNVQGGVELGRARNTFQVEKTILSKKRKFTKRGMQLWPLGRTSKADWVFKSLDTNRWAVRLFETSVLVYFYLKRGWTRSPLNQLRAPRAQNSQVAISSLLSISVLSELPQGVFKWRQYTSTEHWERYAGRLDRHCDWETQLAFMVEGKDTKCPPLLREELSWVT